MDLSIPNYTPGPYHVVVKGKGIWSIHPPVQPFENKELTKRFAGLRPTICTVYGGCIEDADDIEASNREAEANAFLVAASFNMIITLKAICEISDRGVECVADGRASLNQILTLATAAIEKAEPVKEREVANA